MENVYVPPENFWRRLGSKSHLYKLCEMKLGLHLPPISRTPLSFIKQLFSKKKRGIRKTDLVKVLDPKYKELSVGNVWAVVKGIDDIAEYFPDFGENELPDRHFMWDVLNTIKPRTTKKLIDTAIQNRGVDNEEDKDDLIEIAPEYLNELMSVAVQKNVRGKAAYFLRKSSKLKRHRADPKEYDAEYDMFAQEENVLEPHDNGQAIDMNVDLPRNRAYFEEAKDSYQHRRGNRAQQNLEFVGFHRFQRRLSE